MLGKRPVGLLAPPEQGRKGCQMRDRNQSPLRVQTNIAMDQHLAGEKGRISGDLCKPVRLDLLAPLQIDG